MNEVVFSAFTVRRVYRYILTSAKSEFQRVFYILPDETQIFKKSNIQNMLRTLIWYINNPQNLLKIDFSICPNSYEFFQIF